MSGRICFAPTGKPPRFLSGEGLNAFGYKAVRGVSIGRLDAEELGKTARECNVLLTVHDSYYVNLCGRRNIVAANVKRLVQSIQAAEWMGAHQVVFHTVISEPPCSTWIP